jgi:hypothetical protein
MTENSENGTGTYCGYCMLNIYWSNNAGAWVHLDGARPGWHPRECPLDARDHALIIPTFATPAEQLPTDSNPHVVPWVHTRVKVFSRRPRNLFRKTYAWRCPHCDLNEPTTRDA